MTEVENELRQNPEVRKLLRDFNDARSDFALATTPFSRPPASLRDLLMDKVDLRQRIPALARFIEPVLKANGSSVVVTNAKGEVQWFNPTFTRMCGYTLEEVKGRKPGHFLQGKESDPKAVREMSRAVHEVRPHSVELINYHKNGNPYLVSIEIEPVYDTEQQHIGFYAFERELEPAKDKSAAAV